VIAVRIPFLDLHVDGDGRAVREAVERVLARGLFVLGPEVESFEHEFAQASGARHAVGVASGTDAIALLLRVSGIGRGDEVIVPALTAPFTALAVMATGATPVVVDVDDATLTMDPAAAAAAVTSRTAAIVPVHLYGQPAQLDAIRATAQRHGLLVIEDCCQAHLATCAGTPVGTTTAGGAFSFYPTKNLGALGDAGALVVHDATTAERLRRFRNGGRIDRDRLVEAGVNSRLDELQAAVLRARLPLLPGMTARRRELAARYRSALPPGVRPVAEHDEGHVYHLFPILASGRDALRARLRETGVETAIHYPLALTEQPAFTAYATHSCPVAERAARELLSLPLHPRLTDADVAHVTDALAQSVGRPDPSRVEGEAGSRATRRP
jgi:dTDP-3-amino-3,4,6-trideoxy-alpha-D-glucose transaminase